MLRQRLLPALCSLLPEMLEGVVVGGVLPEMLRQRLLPAQTPTVNIPALPSPPAMAQYTREKLASSLPRRVRCGPVRV